jgi:hypothetical protein
MTHQTPCRKRTFTPIGARACLSVPYLVKESQRYGYYRPGLDVDRDEYDRTAVYLTAMVATGRGPDMLIGSARLVVGEAQIPFTFPSQKAFQFELPQAIREVASRQCAEVTRFVSERPEGIAAGGLLVPLGLIEAVSVYSRGHAIRCGLAVVKQRLLRALSTAGVPPLRG